MGLSSVWQRCASSAHRLRATISVSIAARFAWLLMAIPLLAPQQAEASSNWYWFNVSAYCIQGTMADGGWTYAGAVASSPGLPFGTLVNVQGMGEYVVEDRGGAITWRHLDIWMPSCKQAIKFGRQWMLVRIDRMGWWGD